jgi:hypothetical protein
MRSNASITMRCTFNIALLGLLLCRTKAQVGNLTFALTPSSLTIKAPSGFLPHLLAFLCGRDRGLSLNHRSRFSLLALIFSPSFLITLTGFLELKFALQFFQSAFFVRQRPQLRTRQFSDDGRQPHPTNAAAASESSCQGGAVRFRIAAVQTDPKQISDVIPL